MMNRRSTKYGSAIILKLQRPEKTTVDAFLTEVYFYSFDDQNYVFQLVLEKVMFRLQQIH